MFTLWNAVTGEFDGDWHRTWARAARHLVRCKLGRTGWRVVELTTAQAAEVYAS